MEKQDVYVIEFFRFEFLIIGIGQSGCLIAALDIRDGCCKTSERGSLPGE